MDRLKGKVALVTGAARGQGRSHAIHLADEGADIIAFDICADIASNEYPLATRDDLDETVKLVEKSGQRVIAAVVDVRDRAAMAAALDEAVAQLGGLHVVVANAGICPQGNHIPFRGFIDAFDVDFVGVVNTIHLSLEHLTAGGSVIVTGSIAGLIDQKDLATGGGPQGPGGAGYGMAKKMVRDYTKALALTMAPHRSGSTPFTRPTSTPTCCTTCRCTRSSGPTSRTPLAKMPSWFFLSCRRCRHPGSSRQMSRTQWSTWHPKNLAYVTGQQLFVDAGAGLKIGV